MVQPVGQARVADELNRLARDSYGRLLALLATPTGDIAAAEDALADASERALTRWPDDGIPANPEAWILTVARNRLRDMWKSSAYRMTEPLDEIDSGPGEVDDAPVIPDRRLELMLVCAHPAIAHNIRTPLMLQAVLGVEAAAIARAFAVPTATMAQRLVRAKKRIRDAHIPFVLPERDDLAERLPAVLEAVYGAYAIDWQLAPDGAPIESLSAEALHLALVLAELLPDQPEVLGLAALMCLSEARRPARRTSVGDFVPLDEQDTALWDTTLIDRGEALLRRAHAYRRAGSLSVRGGDPIGALRTGADGKGRLGRAAQTAPGPDASRPVAGGGGGTCRGGRRNRRSRSGIACSREHRQARGLPARLGHPCASAQQNRLA